MMHHLVKPHGNHMHELAAVPLILYADKSISMMVMGAIVASYVAALCILKQSAARDPRRVSNTVIH